MVCCWIAASACTVQTRVWAFLRPPPRPLQFWSLGLPRPLPAWSLGLPRPLQPLTGGDVEGSVAKKAWCCQNTGVVLPEHREGAVRIGRRAGRCEKKAWAGHDGYVGSFWEAPCVSNARKFEAVAGL